MDGCVLRGGGEGLALQSSMVTEIPPGCVTLAGTLPGLLVSDGKDLSRRPQVGAGHWEPGLASAS